MAFLSGIVLLVLCQFQALAGVPKSIELPVFPQGSESTFHLHYELYPRAGQNWAADEKTVIFLQGGPGLEGLGHGRPPFVPEDFQVLVFDPRGVGQSRLPESLSSDFNGSSSELLAGDLIRLVEREHLTNFVFWAHSYGTVVATVAASIMKDPFAPKSLILEGTIGRAFKKNQRGDHEINLGYRNAFQQAYSHLTAFDQFGFQLRVRGLSGSKEDLELIGAYIYKVSPQGTYPLMLALAEIARAPWTPYRTLQAQWPAGFAKGNPEENQQVLNIGCSEILEDLNSSMEKVSLFENAVSLETNYAEICKSSKKPQNFYDAAKYPQKTAIIYVADSTDPNTPLWQAEYHEEKMRRAGATTRMIVSYGRGHMPLQNGTPDCRQQVLRAAFTGEISTALTACPMKP